MQRPKALLSSQMRQIRRMFSDIARTRELSETKFQHSCARKYRKIIWRIWQLYNYSKL